MAADSDYGPLTTILAAHVSESRLGHAFGHSLVNSVFPLSVLTHDIVQEEDKLPRRRSRGREPFLPPCPP